MHLERVERMLDKEREMRVDRQTGTENADSSASIRDTVTTFVSPSPSLSYSARVKGTNIMFETLNHSSHITVHTSRFYTPCLPTTK